MRQNKKGFAIGDLLPIAMTFVILAVAIGVGATVLTTVQSGQTANSIAYNVTGFGLTSLNTFGTWLPTIALVVILAVIIGVLVVYLARRFG